VNAGVVVVSVSAVEPCSIAAVVEVASFSTVSPHAASTSAATSKSTASLMANPFRHHLGRWRVTDRFPKQ
jgi:hypothetical protein